MVDTRILAIVVPAEAGTQRLCIQESLDSRFRGNGGAGSLGVIHFRTAQ